MNPELSYAIVTPVRTDARNLRRLAASVDAQTRLPTCWVIVDNGSEDETVEVARGLTTTRDWVKLICIRGEEQPVPGAPIVRAFHAGLRELAEVPEVVVKLDADTSMGADHFEQLTAAFVKDSSLGIASGVCLELDEAGEWRGFPVALGHVRGAVRAYRRECLMAVLPLEERVGWDGIDGWKAAVHGWTTRMLPDLAFYHHRALGARDGAPVVRWRTQGRAAWFMGYRFSYLLLRTLHRARKDRAAFGMLDGFVRAALRREPRYADVEVRSYVSRSQSLRAVASRYIRTRRLPLVH